MSNFLNAATEELQGLERELEADPRYLKAKQLRELIALYRSSNAVRVAEPRAAFVPPAKPAAVRTQDPKRTAILDAVESILKTLGSPYPVKTSEIFEYLPEELRRVIPGRVPKSNLSAMIHNSKRFQSFGREGWGLMSDQVGNPAPVDIDVEALLS